MKLILLLYRIGMELFQFRFSKIAQYRNLLKSRERSKLSLKSRALWRNQRLDLVLINGSCRDIQPNCLTSLCMIRLYPLFAYLRSRRDSVSLIGIIFERNLVPGISVLLRLIIAISLSNIAWLRIYVKIIRDVIYTTRHK